MNGRALGVGAVVAALAAAAPGCGERAVTAPSAGGAGGGAIASAPVAGPATCEGCHASIAAEWRSSFHRSAFSDATFQASLALEERQEHAFCTRCHAPAATAKRGDTAAGVDCVACHADAHAGARAGARAGAGAGICARCHEFTFDDGRPDLVQETVTEHAASAYAAVACVDCHMPAREGHKDHRFVSGHAPARLAGAVNVEVARAAQPNAVRVAIRVDAGHAFPTGDMFRRARLLVFAEGAGGEIVADAERSFGRTWGGVRGGEHAGARQQQSDTRIRGSWSEIVELEAPSAPIVRVRWMLLYERVVAMRGPHVSIASSDPIAEGELRW